MILTYQPKNYMFIQNLANFASQLFQSDVRKVDRDTAVYIQEYTREKSSIELIQNDIKLPVRRIAKQSLDWQFVYNVNKGNMRVTDLEFWEDYNNNKIAIKVGDIFDCRVRSKVDKITGEVIGVEVCKVYSVINLPHQANLIY